MGADINGAEARLTCWPNYKLRELGMGNRTTVSESITGLGSITATFAALNSVGGLAGCCRLTRIFRNVPSQLLNAAIINNEIM